MKCKNCGAETKILVDDGIGSHYEEDEICMTCKGWMVSDSVSLIDVTPPESFTEFLQSIPGIVLLENVDGFWVLPDDDEEDTTS